VLKVPPNIEVMDSRVCENSLKPCIEFRLKVTCELDEVPISVHGLLYSEDGKLIAHLLPGVSRPTPQSLAML